MTHSSLKDILTALPEKERGHFDSESAGTDVLVFAALYLKNAAPVKILLKSGLSVSEPCSDGYNALDAAFANEFGSKEILKAVFAAAPEPSPEQKLRYAVCVKPLKEVEALLKGQDVNARRGYFQSPLLSDAVRFKRSAPFVRALVKTGANVNACDESGQTPLFEAGANVNAVDGRTGASVLCQMAAERGEDFDAVVKMLIKAGADPHLKDKNGADFYAYAFGTK